MEKIKTLLIALLVSSSALFANDNTWKSVDSEIKQIFVPNNNATNKIEIIRLYKNNTFEHLIYTPDKKYSKTKENLNLVHKSKVQRNSGTYSLTSNKINFNCVEKGFISTLYEKSFAVMNNKLYKNKLQSLTNKNGFLFKTTSEKKYTMPFYLDPISNLVVTNTEASEKIDLADLVHFLIKKQKSEFTKFQAISDYFQKDVTYNEDIKLSNYQSLDEQMVKNVMSGEERTVNSKLLAASIEILGRFADLKIRTIDGFLKKQKGFGFEKAEHSWNELTSEETQSLCDISLGNNWLKVDPTIMIYSHFPLNEADQLLENPISLVEFESLVLMEPKSFGAKMSSFLPTKSALNANNKIDLLFDEIPSCMKVEFYNYDLVSNEFNKKVTPISSVKKVQIDSKTLLSIPIDAKMGRLVITSSDGVQISYFITNNGMEETEVAAFIKNTNEKNKIISAIRPSRKNNNTIQVVAAKNISWASSTEPFLNDLASLEIGDNSLLIKPLVTQARKFYGLKEIVGKDNNKIIIQFFKETGNGKIKNDEVAWCSVFVGYCAKQAGFDLKIKPTAKSWLEVGKTITEPQPGDIVVFWREDPNSWKGHVSIFIGKDEETNEIICLGGNQDDQVCIRKYDANSVLGFRRLEK